MHKRPEASHRHKALGWEVEGEELMTVVFLQAQRLIHPCEGILNVLLQLYYTFGVFILYPADLQSESEGEFLELGSEVKSITEQL